VVLIDSMTANNGIRQILYQTLFSTIEITREKILTMVIKDNNREWKNINV